MTTPQHPDPAALLWSILPERARQFFEVLEALTQLPAAVANLIDRVEGLEAELRRDREPGFKEFPPRDLELR